MAQLGPLPARFSNPDAMRRQMMRQARSAILALLVMLATVSPAAAAPEGQMTWGVHVSLAPTWFDPAETQGIITPFMIMYAIHDALVKAMPGNAAAPSLAES
jgi:peptide/nickel transport system substrate-binding protein